MNKSLRGFSKTFAFQALKQLVEKRKSEIALELLSLDLSGPEARKLQGRPLGMMELIAFIENIPALPDED